MDDQILEHAVNLAASLIILVVCTCFASWFHRIVPVGENLAGVGRFGCIDGIRGYLALWVFIYHAALTFNLHKFAAPWPSPTYGYFVNLGQIGVALFFMITGYLFIGRALTRPEAIRWRPLLISRICRIYPLYIFVLGVMFVMTASQSGELFSVGPTRLIKELVSWLTFTATSLNGNLDAPLMIARVEWTLRFEWLFYLAMPLVALGLARVPRFGLFASLVVIYLAVEPLQISIAFFQASTRFFVLFLAGGIAAQINRRWGPSMSGWIEQTWVSVAQLLVLGVVVVGFDTAYGVVQAALLLAFFIPVSQGNSLFGSFKTRGALVLGHLSYSIYLCHGLVLYAVFTLLTPDYIRGHSWLEYLGVLPFVAIAILVISWGSFRLIEQPGIAVGRLWNRAASRA